MKRRFFIFFIVCLLFLSSFALAAKDYKVAVAQLPTTDSYVALIKAIGEETKNNFNIEVFPMARSVYLIENNQVDFQCPLIENPDPKKAANSKFDYSTTTVYKLVFVLYSNKAKNISAEELKKGNPKNYKIETDIAHVDYFNFSCSGSPSIEASLKKVDSGAIDGFIFSITSSDKMLKSLALKNIKRQYFDTFNNKFLIAKGTKGGEIDKMLSDGMTKIKANGKYDQILGSLLKMAEKYDDWQP